MIAVPFVLPLAQITFLTPPPRTAAPMESLPLMPVAILVMVVLGLGILWRLLAWLRRPAAKPTHWILVDGSNVMHWKDATPSIATVQAVVWELKSRGFAPGVVFDANAGYKLAGRYMNEREFARRLELPISQIFVVPKGTPADPYLLSAARDHGARIVTRDRFRDWAEAHPEVAQPGFLIRGGYRDSGALWLDEAVGEATPGAKVGAL